MTTVLLTAERDKKKRERERGGRAGKRKTVKIKLDRQDWFP